MKTEEELNALKNEYEALNAKLAELTGEELEQITGGLAPGRRYWGRNTGSSSKMEGPRPSGSRPALKEPVNA